MQLASEKKLITLELANERAFKDEVSRAVE
jgi:hypothetical protein